MDAIIQYVQPTFQDSVFLYVQISLCFSPKCTKKPFTFKKRGDNKKFKRTPGKKIDKEIDVSLSLQRAETSSCVTAIG